MLISVIYEKVGRQAYYFEITLNLQKIFEDVTESFYIPPQPISTINILLSKLRNQHWYFTVTYSSGFI